MEYGQETVLSLKFNPYIWKDSHYIETWQNMHNHMKILKYSLEKILWNNNSNYTVCNLLVTLVWGESQILDWVLSALKP